MSGFLPIVAAILLAALAVEGRGASPLSAPGILALLAAWYAAGRALAGSLAAAAIRGGADPPRALLRFRRGVALHRAAVLPAAAAVLWPGGWATHAAAVREWAGDGPALADALAPFLVLNLLSRAATYPAERRLGMLALTFRESLGQAARMGLLVLAPIVLVLAATLAAAALADLDLPPLRAAADLAARYEFVEGLFGLAALAAVLAAFPVLAMRILGARPMRDGPLRRRLEAYARGVGLRYRDLYVWPTRGSMLNAAVLGVGARLRCVVFTDALLERLDEEEVEAVFAHEAGHALHHHLPLFFLFTVGYMLALFAASRLLPPGVALVLERDPLANTGFALAGLGIYFWLLFGFVSRRLEQQADVHGLLTVGLPDGGSPGAALADPGSHPFLREVAGGRASPADHPFVRSLERIAATMGGVRELTGWRHFSIADRVDFLDRYARDPAVRDRYRRRLRGLMALLGAMLLLFAAAAATDLPTQMRGPAPDAALRRAATALAGRRVEEAREWIEAGLRGAEARGLLLAPRADRVAPGRPVGALSVLALAQTADAAGIPTADRLRLQECEAILRSVLGRPGEAVAVAEHALSALPDPAGRPPAEAAVLRGLRSEALLVLSEMLRRDGRPAAAEAAREEAVR